MIPVLYSANTTDFSTFGLGVLTDTIFCEVTEERNGVFECLLKYPVSGQHYGLITKECIIKAKPNDTAADQAFRIYRITKPLNSIVTIYGQHISYDLANVPVMPFSTESRSPQLILSQLLAGDTRFTGRTDYSDAKALMLTILASYAQEESRSVSENQKWRVKRNFEAGIPWNGRMLGYRMQEGKYCIIPEEAELVRRIYREFLDGMGRNRIAARLNEEGIQPTRYGEEWHPQTIAKILRNYAYTGNLLLQRFFCESHITKKMVPNVGQKAMYHAVGTHEAIIPLAEWKAAQEEIIRRAERHGSKPPAQPSFFYTGRIQCAKCGKNFRRKTTAARIVWICATLNTKGKKYCASKQIPEATLDELVRQVTDDPCSIEKIIADDGNTLHFHFLGGTVVTRTWTDRSRAESWTPEMKEKARQQSLARRRQKS